MTIRDKIETTRVRISSHNLACIGLINDCYESVKFLNRIPMGVLEESMQVFRQNIFSMSDRK